MQTSIRCYYRHHLTVQDQLGIHSQNGSQGYIIIYILYYMLRMLKFVTGSDTYSVHHI